jgi:hypothetical protein
MSLQDGLDLSGSADPTPARCDRLFPSRYGRLKA